MLIDGTNTMVTPDRMPGRDRGKMEACNHGWGQVKMVAGGVGVTQPGLGDSVYTKEEGGVSSQRQGNEGFGS